MEHMGSARMKVRARQYFWWPKLNDEIENITRQCISCQENSTLPKQATTAMWEWPSGPWKRLHLDYAGPVRGHMFLIVIDSHSKWLEVFPSTNSTTETTISNLWRLFATHGFPEHVVSDNGSQFTSFEFEKFLAQNGIKHTTTAPGHPATNGMAERYVGFVKQQLKKMTDDSPLDVKLSKILLAYRTTPHTATGEPPCELLMKRSLRTKFSLLKPSLNKDQTARALDNNIQCVQKFKVGDFVYALNLRSGARWIAGVIIDVMNRNYHVQVGQHVWKRHEDQLRRRYALSDKTENVFAPVVPVIPQLTPDVAGASAGASTSVASSRIATSDNVEYDSGNSEPLKPTPTTSRSPRMSPDRPATETVPARVVEPERRYPARMNRGELPARFKDFT